MAVGISSAIPSRLLHYSEAATQINEALTSESFRLTGKLQHFEATCTEYRVHVAHLADWLRSYARSSQELDDWVRTVGFEFENADRAGQLSVFRAALESRVAVKVGSLRDKAEGILDTLRGRMGNLGKEVRHRFGEAVDIGMRTGAEFHNRLRELGANAHDHLRDLVSFGAVLLSKVTVRAGELKAAAERVLSTLARQLHEKLSSAHGALIGLWERVPAWTKFVGNIALGFFVIGDVLDLGIQGWNWLWGKPVDTTVTTLAFAGLVADLGWLDGIIPDPADAGNLGLATLKAIVKALPPGAASDSIRELLERAAKNPDDLKRLGETLAPLSKHRDVVEALIQNPEALLVLLREGPQASHLMVKYGVPAVELVGRHGDEALEILGKYGNGGLKILTEYGDDSVALYRLSKNGAEPGIDLLQQELLNGHTLQRHRPSLPTDVLKNRVLGEYDEWAPTKTATKFRDVATMQDAINRAYEVHKDEIVRHFASGGRTRAWSIDYGDTVGNGFVNVGTVDAPILKEISTTKITLRFVPDPDAPDGFRLISAFPDVR